jgi:tRNA(adenine34) deaminase
MSIETREPIDAMQIAFDEAMAAAARGEVPVGAAIVRDGTLLASAGNRTREWNDPTAHAELVAIRLACASVGNERLMGADLYVTLEPCTMCAGAMSFARLRRLYFAAADEKGGAVEHGTRFFSSQSCLHAPDVYGGIRATESAVLLRDFFGQRRVTPRRMDQNP